MLLKSSSPPHQALYIVMDLLLIHRLYFFTDYVHQHLWVIVDVLLFQRRLEFVRLHTWFTQYLSSLIHYLFP